MPPWPVYVLCALILLVVAWGLASWDCDDELTANEKRALDALARIARRRQ